MLLHSTEKSPQICFESGAEAFDLAVERQIGRHVVFALDSMKRGKLSQDFVDSDSDYETENDKEIKSSSPVKTSTKSLNAEESSFELSGTRRVTVRKFRSSILIDIREYYEDKESNEERPGKKGISLTKEQYEKLKELIPEIDTAVQNIK